MRPVHIGGLEPQPGDPLLCPEYMNVVLDEVRHWDEMRLGQIACDAERSTDVLTVDEDVHQPSDGPSPRLRFAVGGGVAKIAQNDCRVLLTAFSPISCYPAVVVEAVAKHSTQDRANSESTLRAGSQVSEHIPDTPLDAQRRRVPLLGVKHSQSLSEVEHLITLCVP